MVFPEYVPKAVREYVTRALSSDPQTPGFKLSLAITEANLKILVHAGVAEWRPDFVEARSRVEEARDALSCICRLAFDARMKDAYTLLDGDLVRDDEVARFIQAAMGARRNYAPMRKRLIRAKEVAKDVATAAAKLAAVLRKAQELEVPELPEEFYSTDALLERARLDSGKDPYVPPPAVVRLKIDKGGGSTSMDPDEKRLTQRLLRDYKAWVAAGRPARQPANGAPFDSKSTPSVVLALEAAARSYKPAEVGVAHAALASRKGNPTTEYLRAFNWALGDIKRTPAVVNAMAIAATVVLDKPEISVTAGDVRSAIARRIVPAKRAHVRARFAYRED